MYRGKYSLITSPYHDVIERLAAHPLTINGQTVSPSVQLICNDGNAVAKTLTCRASASVLSEAGAGGSPTFAVEGHDLLSGGGSGITFGAKYFEDSGTTVGNVGTHDVLDVVLFKATGTTSVLIAKRNAGVGWEIGINASDQLYKTIQDASGSATVVSAALTAGSVYLAIITNDRSGNAQIYLFSATSGAAVDISTRNATLDALVSFTVGADDGGSGLFDSTLYYYAQYHSDGWLDSHLQATLVAELAAIATGYQAFHNHASLTPSQLPTRTVAAYSQKRIIS